MVAVNDIGDNMIIYCSECDRFVKVEDEPEPVYPCASCGDSMIELNEDDLLIKIEEMQKEIEGIR
jgi:cytidine deaminase